MDGYDDDLDCGQINLGVPYRKIDSIQFQLINQQKVNNESVFEIEFECKYEGLNKADKSVKIKRKFADFEWLATSIKSQLSNFIIVPYLQSFQKTYAQSFIWSLVGTKSLHPSSKQSTSQKQADPATRYEQTVIKRFIKILSQISLKYMYRKPGQSKNPLFIFIQNDSNYNFFRSLYDQENIPQESIFSGYLKGVLEFIPTFTKKKSIELYGLGPMQEQVQKLYNKGSELMERLKNYRAQLQKIYENFIQKEQREQLRIKIRKVDTFLYRLEQNLRYTHLILTEITQNIEAYIELASKAQTEVDNYISKLIKEYLGFVEKQKDQINSKIHKIGREFMEENMKDQQRVKISIGGMYLNYQKVN